MTYLYTYITVGILVMIGAPACIKVFGDEDPDEEAIKAGVVAGFFWPLLLIAAALFGIGFGLYWVLVQVLKFIKSIVDEIMEQRSPRVEDDK